jgi:hypothetical protein
VQMTVATNQFKEQSDAIRFAQQSLGDWLTKHAERPNYPYKITVAAGSVKLTGGSAVEAPTIPGARSPGGRTGEVLPAPTPGGKGGPAGRGGTPIIDPMGVAPAPAQLMGGGGQEVGAGPSQNVGGGQADPNQAALASKVKELAPLTPPPSADAGTTVYTFTVTWDAVLVPKAAPAPGGAS